MLCGLLIFTGLAGLLVLGLTPLPSQPQNGIIDEEKTLQRRYTFGFRPIVSTALHTGFQASALQSVVWDDVDVRQRMITVHAVYGKNGGARRKSINQLLTDTWKSVKLATYQGDRALVIEPEDRLARLLRPFLRTLMPP